MKPRRLLTLLTLATVLIAACHTLRQPSTLPHGRAYLAMPPNDRSLLPKTLSQTGAFTALNPLTPAPSLIPYSVNLPFFSDNAHKRRWLSLPQNTTIHFTPTGSWTFPNGTVFVKHFEDAPDKPIETRILVRDNSGFVYGASYRWRPDRSDADLVTESSLEQSPRPWHFLAPKDCRACHTPASSGVLGVNTRQLNHDDQLARLSALFDAAPPAADSLPRLVDPASSSPVELRVKSYLDVNCAQCHNPQTVPDFDARFDTPLTQSRIVNTRVRLARGIDHARIVAPNDPWRSALLTRVATLETSRMPPLGRATIDTPANALLREWILSLPGPPTLPPPTLSPAGGEFAHPVTVTLAHPDPAATLHYTTNGLPPTPASPIYTSPLTLTTSTILRTIAEKPGTTPSIPAQEVYTFP